MKIYSLEAREWSPTNKIKLLIISSLKISMLGFIHFHQQAFKTLLNMLKSLSCEKNTNLLLKKLNHFRKKNYL